MNIEQLFATANMDFAGEQSQTATFPYLRELADFIAGGGRFPGSFNDIIMYIIMNVIMDACNNFTYSMYVHKIFLF